MLWVVLVAVADSVATVEEEEVVEAAATTTSGVLIVEAVAKIGVCMQIRFENTFINGKCFARQSIDSDKSSADRYEDEDTHYDGEREGSDSDSPSPR